MFEKLELWKQQKKRLGLKYDDIAAMSNIPKGTIQNIFAGYIDNPRIDTVQAIEKALGLSADSPPPTELTEPHKRLLEAFDELIPPMQEYVIEMTEKLVESQREGNTTRKKA